MQKLPRRRLTDTPRNASLVPCSVDLSLNKEETLSEQVLSTIDNNPEVNQPQCKEGQSLRVSVKVYILNMRGNPLMPCDPRKAKKLLKEQKAVVVKRLPFTIQLLIPTGETKQKIILGIDSGYGNIGFSAVSKKDELISGTVKLDGRTSERLTERRMYRRNRKNRLWYRKPKFLNRSKPKGWLPPSVQRRYDTHLNLINRIKKILPVSETIIEVANFDIQKLVNPDISGTDYQQGSLYEYQNMRSYLMAREKGKCQLCGKDFKGQPSHIHHCKQRKESGSNRAENLAILHKSCHERLHKKGLKLPKPKSYKPNTFMSIIHKRFWQDVNNLQITYGYETFVKRNELNLEKSHSSDAFVIAKGTIQNRRKEQVIQQKHRNNRVLQLNRKGFKPSIKKEKSKVNPEDLFWVNGKQYICKGMFNKGQYITYGSTKKKEYFKFSKVEKIYHQGSFAWNT
jgi:hypothetical protein